MGVHPVLIEHMNPPSFRSMHLLQGFILTLAAWVALMWFLTSPVSPNGRIYPDWEVIRIKLCYAGIPFALLVGWAYALIQRQEARIRSLITDDQLPLNERVTLAAIRAANPWAKTLPTKTLHAAYLDWCHLTFDNVAKGQWVDRMIPADLDSFLSWAFTRPIDRF